MSDPLQRGLAHHYVDVPGILVKAPVGGVLVLVLLLLAGVVGLAVQQPWLFPSLGPSTMLLFESPQHVSSRPLNIAVGHAVGIASGWLMLVAFSLQAAQPAPVGGLNWAYVLAGALSVTLTFAVLTLIRLPHSPAASSALIVSLGILTTGVELASMMGAVVLISIAGLFVRGRVVRVFGDVPEH
jgi:hypothetical protein